MTIKRRKQIAMGVLVAATAVAVPVATVVSCGSKKSETSSNGSKGLDKWAEVSKLNIKDFPNVNFGKEGNDAGYVDSQKVKLVSFGDSVASAASQLDAGTDHRGHLNSKGEVTGMSYGSYMAKAFQKHGKLGDFSNFSLAGLISGGMRKMIDPSWTPAKWEADNLKRIEGSQDGQAPRLNSSPEENKRFDRANIRKKIKEANLITMTIGADDILGLLRLGGLSLNELTAGKKDMTFKGGLAKVIDYNEKEFNSKIHGVVINIAESINAIKKINPKAKVVLTSYPMPVLQLNPLFSLIKIDGKSLSHSILAKLNAASKFVAEHMSNVDYVNVYDNNYWAEHALDLAPELFDIHPGAQGYKAMAGIILDKLNETNAIKTKYTNFKTNDDSTHHILNDDYTNDILNMYDYKNKQDVKDKTKANPYSLSTKNSEIDNRAKKWKLAHFTAGLIGKVFTSPKTTTPSSTHPAAAAKGETKIEFDMETAKSIIKSLINSANYGLIDKDAKVVKELKQDSKYLIYKLLEIVKSNLSLVKDKDYKDIVVLVSAFIPDAFDNAKEFKKVIWDDIIASSKNKTAAEFDKEMQSVLKAGPSTWKIKIGQTHRNLKGQPVDSKGNVITKP